MALALIVWQLNFYLLALSIPSVTRFRRYILNGLTVLSLVLAIATAGLWVRSVFRLDASSLTSNKPETDGFIRSLGFHSATGGFAIAAIAHERPIPSKFQWYSGAFTDRPLVGRVFPHRGGFGWRSQRDTNGTFFGRTLYQHQVDMPYWLPLVLFAVLPGACLYRIIRRRRRTLVGHCPACGYDMRANPAKCSECGHEPTASGSIH